MPNFTVSFRISDKTVAGRDYNDRYKALTDALTSAGSGTSRFWAEASSFFAIQTTKSIDDVITACRKAIAPADDIVLVLDADNQSGRVLGKNDDPDLFDIIAYVRKA